MGEVEGVHGVPDAGVDGESEGEPDPAIAAGLGELMGGPAVSERTTTIGPFAVSGSGRHAAGSEANAWSRTVMWSAAVFDPAFPALSSPAKGLTAGDLGAVQKRQQRVMAEGLLPRRRRLGFVVGMVDDQGGVISIYSGRPRVGAAPAAQAAARAAARAPRTLGRCAASMRESTSRHIVVVEALAPNTCSRSAHSCPTPSMQSAPSATAAARSANTSRGIHPRPLVGVSQRGRDLGGQPGLVGQFPQQPHPGVRHPVAVRRDFHRCAAAILFTCEVPSCWTTEP